MQKKVFCFLLAACLLLSLTACKEEIKGVAAPTLAETTKVVETTITVTEPEGTIVLDDSVDGKVCVGFMPTEAGTWRYVVIEDQEAAVAAYVKAASAIYSDEWWVKGDRTCGMIVAYNGMIWEFVESGELVYSLGRVKEEDADDLYALCEEAAREAGWKEAVTPEQITNIVSATLRASGKEFSLTDEAALDQMEGMLTGAKFALGGTGCPFTALLDLETESGEILTVALATDSCGVWMSEGYYYEFSNDSQSLYDLFGVTLKFGEIVK